jgi:hypothetical protein
MRRTAEAHDRIARELNEERVSALRRITETLETLIAELTEARQALRNSNAAERTAAIAGYRALRARAVQYRWYLEVQREAMGLRHHHRLDDFYRIPPDLS